MTTSIHLYVDGGLIGRNPSPLGGTWCWVQVSESDEIIEWGHGTVTPDEIGLKAVTNNFSELLAAVLGLESLPMDWKGIIHTDSKVTLLRLTKSCKFNGIPPWLIHRVNLLKRKRRWRVALLRGHPTKTQLKSGWAGKLPVSKWNVFADEHCTDLAREFLEKPIERETT